MPRAPLHLTAAKIVAGARAQIGTRYTVGYFAIAYPGGDLPRDKGVCTDVVVRALRAAGHDLQRLIHEDMRRAFRRYPQKWGLRGPDKNIDHRRVPNQQRFFERHGLVLPARYDARTKTTFLPGDVVTWKLPSNLDHTGIVSDRTSGRGVPLVLHNLGVCAEEDVLLAWPLTGHYRYPKR